MCRNMHCKDYLNRYNNFQNLSFSDDKKDKRKIINDFKAMQIIKYVKVTIGLCRSSYIFRGNGIMVQVIARLRKIVQPLPHVLLQIKNLPSKYPNNFVDLFNNLVFPNFPIWSDYFNLMHLLCKGMFSFDKVNCFSQLLHFMINLSLNLCTVTFVDQYIYI